MSDPLVAVLNDPPDWLDYLTAFGTLGAAIIPLLFFLLERKDRKVAQQLQYAAEERQAEAEKLNLRYESWHRDRLLGLQEAEVDRLKAIDEATREKEARAQAELIHVWTAGFNSQSRVHVLNTSRAPVSMLIVRLELKWWRIDDTDSEFEVLTEDPLKEQFTTSFDQLGPTGEQAIQYSLRETDWQYLGEVPDGHKFGGMEVKFFLFIDAAGVMWRRTTRSNRLVRVDAPPPDSPQPPGES